MRALRRTRTHADARLPARSDATCDLLSIRMFSDIVHLQTLSSCVGNCSDGLPVQFGIASFNDADASKAWLSDSNNGGAVDLTGSDQVCTCSSSLIVPRTRQTCQIDVTPALRLGAPGPFLQHPPRDLTPPCPTHLACVCAQGAYSDSAINTYWSDTTNMDNLRGADITGDIAGTIETISDNVDHTASDNAQITLTNNAQPPP